MPISVLDNLKVAGPAGRKKTLHRRDKAVIFSGMHFSRHISQLHSTSSLLAALLLRVAR
ncbi:MAG: hypothetical protein WDM70_09145 [Nitrosomonadales bacterium]